MADQKQYWNKVHESYAQTDWINKPSLFATQVIEYFPTNGLILELGAGQGQDSRYFAENGYTVIATDLSEEALTLAKHKTDTTLEEKISYQQLDITNKLPFPDNHFNVVYSHLATHYFDDKTTDQIFAEIHRVLKPDGVIAVLVNSTNDPEYGKGIRIGENFFEFDNGIQKRYFSTDSISRVCKDFNCLLLDDDGETFKDQAIGVSHLIRFIGYKKNEKS